MSVFVTMTCCRCGIEFGITASWRQKLIDSHNYFYCPSGHSQSYERQTDQEKEEQRLTQRNERLYNQTKSLEANVRYYMKQTTAYKGQATRLRNKLKGDGNV